MSGEILRTATCAIVFALCLCSAAPGVSRAGDERPMFLEERRTRPEKLIGPRSMEEVGALRARLIRFLWGVPELPALSPVRLDDRMDEEYRAIPSLARVERYELEMEFGLDSNIRLFIPRHPNGRVFFYHQGHRGHFRIGIGAITGLLDEGFAVCAFCMPLYGLNHQPVVRTRRFGALKMLHHDLLKFLDVESGSAFKYFVEPVVAMLNFLEKKRGVKEVFMTGISGGGWTATLAAALDTRIKMCFPVSGSLPVYLRQSTLSSDWGDWEQTDPALYNVANYPELYLLAATGQGRGYCEVINRFDPECFGGTKARWIERALKRYVGFVGSGVYAQWLDETHAKHEISRAALRRMLDVSLGRIEMDSARLTEEDEN